METKFEYGQDQAALMREVQRIIVQQDDYRGMGGHGVQDSEAHGRHSQVSIGVGNDTTVNFRERQE